MKIASQTARQNEQPNALRPYPHGFRPLFAMDNAAVHKSAIKMLINEGSYTEADFVKIPPYSPDIMKAIEHTHAIVCTHFRKELMKLDKPYQSLLQYQALMEHMFNHYIKRASMRRDIESLKETFEQIIKEGGGWPAKQYR